MHRLLPLILLICACDVSGCAALPSGNRPSLEAVISRVDVPRLLECAGAGSGVEIAKCLGARAMTEGLRIAVEEATRLAEDAELASAKGSGAAAYTASQRQSLAVERAQALDAVASEIAATNSEA